MSEESDKQLSSSCPGKSAKRVFAQVTRPSTTFVAGSEDVDGRDKPGHDGGGKRRFLRIAAFSAVALVLIAGAFAAWVYSLGPLPLEQARQVSTTIVDRNGKLLRAYAMADGRWRLPVDGRTAVDPGYLKLLFAYEDRRFYQHGGVDPLALGRAALQLITSGHIVSGGSTITMQLARLMEPRRERSVYAKLRQVVRAIELERQLSKDQILDLYLALAPFGGNLEGIRVRLDRLFRQGAEAAVAGRIRTAGGAAAVAGAAPARSLSRGRTYRARSRARPYGRRRRHLAG